jgi:hypothetical protein
MRGAERRKCADRTPAFPALGQDSTGQYRVVSTGVGWPSKARPRNSQKTRKNPHCRVTAAAQSCILRQLLGGLGMRAARHGGGASITARRPCEECANAQYHHPVSTVSAQAAER